MAFSRLVFVCFSTLLVHLSFVSNVYAIDLYAAGSYWNVDDGDDVWGAALGASFPLLTEHLRLDGRVYLFQDSDLDDDGDLELVPIDFGAQFHFLPNGEIDPYVLGGASWTYADSDRIDVDNSFGAYIGGGIDFALFDNLKPFGELLYRFTELDADRRFSDDDIEVSGLTANVGLKLHF